MTPMLSHTNFDDNDFKSRTKNIGTVKASTPQYERISNTTRGVSTKGVELDFTELEKKEIEICLNCDYPICRGSCDKIKKLWGHIKK